VRKDAFFLLFEIHTPLLEKALAKAPIVLKVRFSKGTFYQAGYGILGQGQKKGRAAVSEQNGQRIQATIMILYIQPNVYALEPFLFIDIRCPV